MNRQAIKELIPVLLLLIAIVYSLVIIATTDLELTIQHYIAYTLIAIATISFFFHRSIYLLILGITLLAGTFDLLSFTPTTYTVTFIIVHVQPFFLVVLIIYCIIFRNEVLGLLDKLSSEL